MTRFKQQLRGKVALLIELRGFQIVVRVVIIGAGILPVPVEEQIVEHVR